MTNLQHQNDALQAENKHLRDENSRLYSELLIKTGELKATQQEHARCSGLKDEIKALRADNGALRLHVERLEQANEALGARLDELGKENAELKRQNADLKRENAELKKKISELEATIAKLAARVDDLQVAVDGYRSSEADLVQGQLWCCFQTEVARHVLRRGRRFQEFLEDDIHTRPPLTAKGEVDPCGITLRALEAFIDAYELKEEKSDLTEVLRPICPPGVKSPVAYLATAASNALARRVSAAHPVKRPDGHAYTINDLTAMCKPMCQRMALFIQERNGEPLFGYQPIERKRPAS